MLVIFFGVLQRNENKVRSKQVNEFLQSVKERKTKDQPLVTWRYRTVTRYITWVLYFNRKYATHLNEDGLYKLRTLFKDKLLYKKYNKDLNKLGNDEVFECERDAGTGEALCHNL